MKRFILLTYLLSLSAFASRGTIVVLEAPLFQEPSAKTKIIQYVRKNDVIKIHNKHTPPLIYQLYDEPILKEMDTSKSQFYTTQDRSGRTAYILKDHVKIIYNDIREFFDKSRLTHDPTDYRLAEPLPENFPLQKTESYEATASIGYGSSDKTSYPYPTTAKKENFSLNQVISLSYARKIDFDITNRFYFGMMLYYQQGNNQFDLNNFTSAKERLWQIGLGPYLSYLAFRNHRFHLNLYGGITLGYAKSIVGLKHPNYPSTLERSFSSYLFKGQIGLQLTHKFLPKIDLTLSTQLEATLPYTQKSDSPPRATSIWNNSSDQISHSTLVGMSLLAGIIAYY